MVYTLTFVSGNDTNTITIETKNTNPIPEDQVKHMLVLLAAHDYNDTFIKAISEDLYVRDTDKSCIYCTDPFITIPEDVIERSVISKYNEEINKGHNNDRHTN